MSNFKTSFVKGVVIFAIIYYTNVMIKLQKRKFLLIILCVIAVLSGLTASVFAGFNIIYIKTYVTGLSMSPTLNAGMESGQKGDKIYINRFAKLKVDDIVVLDVTNNPAFEGNYIVKRLIAVEGDIVNIEYDNENKQYNLIVNGEVLYSKENAFGAPFEPNTVSCLQNYIEENLNDSSRICEQGIIIKKGEVFLLGDNWNVSKDSSLLGPFNKSDLVGRVDIVVHKGENTFAKIMQHIF